MAGQCAAAAAHGTGPCHACGPAAPAGSGVLCGQTCCASGQRCVNGTCTATTCTAPEVLCNGVCVDLNTDVNNCGACGKGCPSGQPCTNGLCTTTTSCTNGVKDGTETDVDCGGPSCPPCAAGKACLVGSDCQTNVCTAGICADFCTGVVCPPQDQCHLAGICDPATGQCSNPVAPNGTACNDGNAYTQTDTCQNGVCTGSNPVTCTALDQCHVAGTCDPTTGMCANPAAPNDTACTVNGTPGTCQSGICLTTCSLEGEMRCQGTGFVTCDHGVWVFRDCAPGTVCRPFNGSILCDWPQ
jgi:hypothetical protein